MQHFPFETYGRKWNGVSAKVEQFTRNLISCGPCTNGVTRSLRMQSGFDSFKVELAFRHMPPGRFIDGGVIDEILIAPSWPKEGEVRYSREQHWTLSWRTQLAVRFDGPWKESWFMPLTQGKIVGYDADLMAFKFTMRNGQQIVQCQISIAALSNLADRRRGSTGDLQC